MKIKKPYEIRRANNGEYYYCKIGANGEYMNHSLPETYPTRQGVRKAMIQSINVDMRYVGLMEYSYSSWKSWATDKTLSKYKQ